MQVRALESSREEGNKVNVLIQVQSTLRVPDQLSINNAHLERDLAVVTRRW